MSNSAGVEFSVNNLLSSVVNLFIRWSLEVKVKYLCKRCFRIS